MMKYVFLFIFLCLLALQSISGQEKFEIRFVSTGVGIQSNTLCFDTQYKNISQTAITLGGQNYRIYYDALQLKVSKETIKSLLSQWSYEAVDVNQTFHNIDARGYGDLSFSQNLAFINYSIRTADDLSHTVKLEPNSGWLSTSNVCFVINNSAHPLKLLWAREGLTDGYATAFTEISVIDNYSIDKIAQIQVYQDYNKQINSSDLDPVLQQSVQNH